MSQQTKKCKFQASNIWQRCSKMLSFRISKFQLNMRCPGHTKNMHYQGNKMVEKEKGPLVLSSSFDLARHKFQLCSSYVSTVLDTSFDYARAMFRQCSTQVLTMLELCFDRAQHKFRLCSSYVSTVLDISFDCARPMF